MSGHLPGPGEPERPPCPQNGGGPAAERSVVVQGDNRGIVSTGDNAFNVIYAHGRFVEVDSVMELPFLTPPPLPASPAVRLFGRDALVDHVVECVTAGRSAQLYGQADIGKKAITTSVHRRLAAKGGRGHVLLPRAGETQSLEALYTRLAGLFFGRNFLRGVDESMLRARAAEISAHITLADCALGREDLSRLLETFPGCTFLLTSPYRTLPEAAAAFHVQPLSRAAAVELLSFELGLPDGPIGLQNPQFDHVYRMSEGRPQRLRLFAGYIRTSDEWHTRAGGDPFDQPAATEPGHIGPRQQAQAVAVALGEPARRLLVALAAVGAPLAPAWCAAVTGDPAGAESADELHDRRLVTRGEDGTVAATADAVAAVTELHWERWDPSLAAEGILSLLGGPSAPSVPTAPPAPQLLLAVARGLDEARDWAALVRFVRSAAPLALQCGYGRTAVQLYVLGRKAAGLSGADAEARLYFRTGEQARTVLDGDRIAVATALAVLATEGTHIGEAAGIAAHASDRLATDFARRVGRIVHRLVRFAQAKPALAVATAIAVAGAATGVVVAAAGSSGPPAGCSILNESTSAHGAAGDRQESAQFTAAAAQATDPALKSALQTEAADWDRLAADEQRYADDQTNDHTDANGALGSVNATIDQTGDLSKSIRDMKAVLQICEA